MGAKALDPLDLYDIRSELSEDEVMVKDTVGRFVDDRVIPLMREAFEQHTFPMDLVGEVAELGLFGSSIEGYDCAGLNGVSYGLICQELERGDSGLRSFVSVQSSLVMFPIHAYGSDEQKERWLPAMARGEAIGCFGLTEPHGGSDPGNMKTHAKRDGDDWIINGAKMWITNGAVSDTELGDTFLVYARVQGSPRNQLSMFIVEKGFAGFSLGQKIKGKLGMRASTTAELVFEDCQVPAENLVGAEGAATLHMMRNLELERVTLAGMSLGIARRSIEVMNRYASERTSFGKPLREFGQIQRYISQSYAEYMAGRAYTYYTASTMSLDTPGHRLDSDGAKLFTSTMAKDVADRAIQVLGGFGYVAEYVVERLWRDAKLLEIGGGTLEAHQKNMCRELGHTERIL